MSTSRARILAAAQAIHSSNGLGAVSMRNVAEAAGLKPMSLYKHYPNKEALLDAIVDAGFDQFVGWLGDVAKRGRTPLARITYILRRYLDFACQEPRVFALMFMLDRKATRRFPDDFAAGKSKPFSMLVHEVQQCMADGIFRHDDALEVGLALWAHAHGLITLYRAGRFGGSEESFRRLYLRSLNRLMRGITELET